MRYFMLRLFLFFATNIAVMALISLIFNLIGFQGLMQANGVDLDLNALLVYSAVIGFSGSFISLLLSNCRCSSYYQISNCICYLVIIIICYKY